MIAIFLVVPIRNIVICHTYLSSSKYELSKFVWSQ
jgi:hypothetical protein